MFIKDMSCISTQETHNNNFPESEVKVFDTKQFWAIEPDYKGLIPSGLLRRMSKLVRMSVGAGMPLLNKHKNIEGIIIGSTNGSIDKSLRFLNQIIDYDEGTLTPTDFVQSTSNCVAGTLALMGNVTGYNNTHVNQGLSFESSVLDALLLLEEGNVKELLLGAGEELSLAHYNIDSARGLFKDEDISSSDLMTSTTKGTSPGEGVSMFVVEAEKSENSLAEIVDVDMSSYITQKELSARVVQFLKKNELLSTDIDTVFMGRNGDVRTDFYFDYLQEHLFSTQSIYTYKALTGDFYTASSFPVWLTAKLFSGHDLPECIQWNRSNRKPKNVLLYNHYEGKQHGLILMKSI